MVEQTAFGEMEVAETRIAAVAQFPYNIINTRLYTSTTNGSGTVTASSNMAQIASGAATSSDAKLETIRTLRYLPGRGGIVRFTCIFGTPAAGNTQIIGLGDDNDGFFFGYNGTSFGVMRRSGGTDTWVAESDWLSKKLVTSDATGPTIDTTKGNVYQIEYQWLGFGAIRFYIENPDSGLFELVHQIDYANRNTSPSIENPTLPLMVESANTTNDTSVIMKTPSMMAGVQGDPCSPGIRWSTDGKKTTVTTKVAILTIRNKTTYQSATNRVPVKPDVITVATDGTKTVTFRVILNTTLGGSPSYTDINADNSVVDVDTAGTTTTGGIEVLNFQLGKADSDKFFISDLLLGLNPGDTLTITAESSANTDVAASIGWLEMV